MSSGADVPLVSTNSSIASAIFEMTSKRMGVTGVVNDEGTLVGVLSDGDLRRALEGGFYDRPVTAAMGLTPRTIEPDALAESALKRLNTERITSLFVIEKGLPVGIITIHDLLRAGVA